MGLSKGYDVWQDWDRLVFLLLYLNWSRCRLGNMHRARAPHYLANERLQCNLGKVHVGARTELFVQG